MSLRVSIGASPGSAVTLAVSPFTENASQSTHNNTNTIAGTTTTAQEQRSGQSAGKAQVSLPMELLTIRVLAALLDARSESTHLLDSLLREEDNTTKNSAENGGTAKERKEEGTLLELRVAGGVVVRDDSHLRDLVRRSTADLALFWVEKTKKREEDREPRIAMAKNQRDASENSVQALSDTNIAANGTAAGAVGASSFAISTSAPASVSTVTSAVDGKMTEALAYLERDQRHRARQACLEVLKLDPRHSVALHLVAGIHSSAGLPDKALPFWKRAVDADGHNVAAIVGLGDCLLAVHDKIGLENRSSGTSADETTASDVLQNACRVYSTALGEAQRQPERPFRSYRFGDSSDGGHVQQLRPLDIRVKLARALYLSRLLDTEAAAQTESAACQLVMSAITSEAEHFEALLLYGEILFDRRDFTEALRTLLGLMVRKEGQSDPRVKQAVARCMDDGRGPALLYDLLGGGVTQNASALKFIAGCLKEHGRIDLSAKLHAHALTCPSSPEEGSSIALLLSYIHVLEVQKRFGDAIQAIIDYAETSTGAPIFCIGGSLSALHLRSALSQLVASRPEIIARLNNLNTFISPEDELPAGVRGFLETVDVPELAEGSVVFSHAELDALALLMSVCKMLAIAGLLRFAFDVVVPLIERVRKGHQDLHLTHIRNENAYYNCLSALLISRFVSSVRPNRQEVDESTPLFVCGDSHSLSSSWQQVEMPCGHDGSIKRRYIKPALVTGLKCWHLRDGCDFYPRAEFDLVTSQIPNGADVVFLFGEIDCREGVLRAVEQGKYDSLEAGIAFAVGIYLRKLQELASKRKWRVFVHPVPPVLDVTRRVVSLFQAVMEQRLASLRSENIRLLEFFDGLLLPRSPGIDRVLKSLDKRFDLDSTHLHPLYVAELLQPALLRACQKSTS